MSRFSIPQDQLFKAINTSIGFDRRLYPQDIDGSLAHAAMLAKQGIIDESDLADITRGLAEIRSELDDGTFAITDDDEDIHLAIERRLTELVGDAGARLHTARSRNDQVATDVALFTRRHALAGQELLTELMQELLDLAERHKDWAIPGYTHLQRAQSVLLGHHLMAYFWMFRRDRDRFAFVASQCAELPLGAGALAGVTWNIDRGFVADQLGFERVAPNSMDAVANRDFVLDYLGAAATCATHLSRFGAEIVLWSSEEFGFCEVSDGFASGSSIMPQKKNPDAAELLRGKSSRVVANFSALQGVMHGLPLTYNKDLQEDKERLFDSVDTIELCLSAACAMLASIEFNQERLNAAANDEFLAAVDIADLLVKKGLPFRQAHAAVAAVVGHAVAQNKQLSQLSLDELSDFSDHFDDDYFALLSNRGWITSKQSEGGTAPERLDEQFELARQAITLPN